MILAAGRGERMRPLSDTTPKPLLEAGGKPLIVWQIEALARAGFRDIVVNVSASCGASSSRRWATARRSASRSALVGRARAARGRRRHRHGVAAPARRTRADRLRRRLHVVRLCVASPPGGRDGARRRRRPRAPSCWSRIRLTTPAAISRSSTASSRSTRSRGTRTRASASTTRRSSANFRAGTKLKLLPYLQRWIADGRVSGETFAGAWANVGTPEDLAELDVALRGESRGARRTMPRAPADE